MSDHPNPSTLPTWAFGAPGPERERICGLVLAGAKTMSITIAGSDQDVHHATTVGDRFVMLSSNGVPLAVLEIVAHEHLASGDVCWEHVTADGESFASIESWREAFRRKHAREVPSPVDDAALRCLTFRVARRLAGHDRCRYPVVECLVPHTEVELAVDRLDFLGTVGVEEIDGDDGRLSTAGLTVGVDTTLLRAGFASDEAAIAAERALDPAWAPRYEVLLGDDWLDAWREHFGPQRIGRVVIVPDWPGATTSFAGAHDDVVVRLDPARSFGTGAHPSTRLVLSALQRLPISGRSIADIGCGSGVLSAAALLLGASHVHGTDVDRAALEATVDNAQRNGVSDRCEVSFAPDGHASAFRSDIVLANILAPVLIDEAERIAATVADGGMLVLAGLVDDQRSRVLAAFPSFRVVDQLVEDPWIALVLQRP